MEDYYEYLDSNGVTTLYKLIKDDTVALIDSYSVTINGITTTLDNHVNNADIHTPISTIEGMIDTAVGSLNYATPDYVDTKVADLVNSSPETLDTLKELSDALGNDSNFATTVANQIGSKANKDDVYTKGETDTLLEGKANSEHNHVVSDITDFPTIPTKVSELTNDSGYITSVSWEDVTSKPELSQVAISGSYSDLSDTPIIPTKTSQLINDSGFLTSSNGLITSVSWSDITNKPNFSTVATSGSYNDLSNKPTIPNVYNKTLTIQKNGTNVATFTSNSNTDVTADITVPTKVSELSNDSGFITGISWDKVTNKPTLATVATSGSYTDLSNTPTIPTKVSQLENDMGFGTGGDTSDCVHKTGNETINGIKTFTQDINFKNNYIDLTVTPSSTLYSNFIFRDKNGQTVSYIQYAKRNVEPDVLGLYINDKDKNLHGIQITSNNYLLPMGNNIWNLGSPGNKWLKVHSDDVVHTSGNETIAGSKTFTNQMYLGGGGTSYGLISAKDNNSILRLFGGTSPSTGANLDLYGENVSNGGFSLRARTSDKIVGLDGKIDGTLKWNGKNVALDENLVHRSGNETISGVKSFNNLIYIYDNMSNKNNQMDLFKTPANTLFSHYVFVDKNNEVSAYMQYGQQNTGTDFIGLFIHDKSRALHGLQVTSNNSVIPLTNNAYSLGGSANKWKNVYATTFNGDSVICTNGNAFMAQNGGYTFLIRNDGSNTYFLMSDKDGVPGTWSTARPLMISNATGICSINGNANTATYATTQATSDNSTKIATTAWVRTYVNSVGGSGNSTIGSSISAYWSTGSKVTDTKQASNERDYPECYSSYINRTPSVGIIYSGAQLYTSLDVSANATGELGGSVQDRRYITKVTAQATFSNPISSTGKYLCTTANTVSFRAYTPGGKSRPSASVIDNTSTKSIFIRVE